MISKYVLTTYFYLRMKMKYNILFSFLLLLQVCEAQYFTEKQIDSISDNGLGYEGDLYMDTTNGVFNLGLTSGRLKSIGVSYINDTLTDSTISFKRDFSIYSLQVTGAINLSFIDKNLGHRVLLKVFGDTTPVFPNSLIQVQGEFVLTDTNYLEITCIDTASGLEKYVGYYHQSASQTITQTVETVEDQLDIFKAKLDAEDGDLAKTIKICPVGTNIPTNVVSYADGNVIYIIRNGQTDVQVLARLDKHEVFSFNASQGDRVYSVYGDAVISNAFGTIAWISLALSGREFYTYVARNASGANPARLFIASFTADANIEIQKNGAPYLAGIVPKQTVVEFPLDQIQEYFIQSDQLIGLWYVGNDNTVDAKPLPPVSSDLLWWNTAANASFTPRISALYPNTNIEIRYRDGTSETAVVNPGTPFVAKFGGGAYQQYQQDGGAIIRADGIISGANAADADGLNGTAWYSKSLTAKHFILPVSAQHISFVSEYEGDILVRNQLDDSVTTIRMTRAAAVVNDQSYPASVRYNPPGGGIGYSFECQVPANCVFDSDEAGFAGDETVLFGGKLAVSDGIIIKDRGTKRNMRLFIENGVIQVEGL